MTWTVAEIIEATGGSLISGAAGAIVGGFSTDTRLIEKGDCFIPLSGENHDAHDFIPEALKKGAGAVIVAAGRLSEMGVDVPGGVSVVEAPDTLRALGDLARFHRRRYRIPVVGITGSNGKTSTKELTASILGAEYKTLKNKGNFNNLIGVPLTLLELGPKHEAAVIELGINIPGEMARLVDIAGPTAGVITNIQPAHLEGLVSLDRILEEKGELLSSLGPEGLAAVNMDDERLRGFSKSLKCRIATYSTDDSADVGIVGPIEAFEDATAFRMRLGRETIPVRLPTIGLHQVRNALAAAALAWGMGESEETISSGLAAYRPVSQRMQIRRRADGGVIVDDTYNANPGSTMAAIQAVISASRGKPVIAVLGGMRELGPDGPRLHRDLGREIAGSAVVRLITVGRLAEDIHKGALDGGMSPAVCSHVATHEEAVDLLRDGVEKEAWILVKGSRAITMERVVEGILSK